MDKALCILYPPLFVLLFGMLSLTSLFLAACYQLMQSVLKVLRWHKMWDRGRWASMFMKSHVHAAPLAGCRTALVVRSLVLAGPFFSPCQHKWAQKSLLSPCRGKWFSVRWNVHWSETIESLLMSGCGQGHGPTEISRKLWLKFAVLAQTEMEIPTKEGIHSPKKTCSKQHTIWLKS